MGKKARVGYELGSVREKCLESQLHYLIRERFGVCEAEAASVVAASLDHLRLARPAERSPFDIVVEVPAGCAIGFRGRARQGPVAEVVLPVAQEDDADVWLSQGVHALQAARIVRLVEHADRAGTTLPLGLLTSLVHLNNRTITQRLRPLWRLGLYLPVLGVADSWQRGGSRLARVLAEELHGRAPVELRPELFLSPTSHHQLVRLATAVADCYLKGATSEEIAGALRLSPREVESTVEVIRAVGSGVEGERLEALLAASEGAGGRPARSAGELRAAFEARLMRWHSFSPARAALLVQAVEEAAANGAAPGRGEGEILYWAVREGEPPGKALRHCELVPTRLPFYVPDEDRVPRDTSSDLKVRKALRLAAAAHRQGALLTLPDLAFLLGMGGDSLQKAFARDGVIPATRGNIMDIGRGVTHRVKIVTLYVEGYTEAQIVRQTHHSYESVGSYIDDFRRVLLLADQGLPPEHIRKVLKMSRRLVDAYLALYRELDTPPNQWKLNLMRRAAVEQKKKARRQSS